MKCWFAPSKKTDKDSLFWGEQTIERKKRLNVPRPRGGYLLFRRVVHHRIEFIDRTEAVAIHRTALQLQRHALRRGLQRQYAGVTQLL